MARTVPPGRHLTSTGSLRRTMTLPASSAFRRSTEPLCEIYNADAARRRTKVCSQPLSVSGHSEPPGRLPPAPGPGPSVRPVAGGPFASSGGVRVSSSFRRFLPHLVGPRGTRAMTLGRMLCLEWLTASHQAGKLRSACDPCPVMARTEPPGRLPLLHRVPISATVSGGVG